MDNPVPFLRPSVAFFLVRAMLKPYPEAKLTQKKLAQRLFVSDNSDFISRQGYIKAPSFVLRYDLWAKCPEVWPYSRKNSKTASNRQG